VIASLRFIQPSNPISAKQVPAGDGWLHELKLDGYRLQVVKSDGQVRLYSRRGYNWTNRLPILAEVLTGIPAHAAILDAELCLLGADGAPNFYRLLARMQRRQHELAVYAFDLLHLDGEDLRP